MSLEYIEIIGARENNLKNISLKTPKKKITIFTCVSGSGKSSIVFETIARESSRQLNDTFSNFIKGFLPKYSQPDADSIKNISASIIIDQKKLGGNSRSTLGTITDIDPLIRLMFSKIGSPVIGGRGHFSFNHQSGMCPHCEGVGKVVTLDLNLVIDKDKSLNDGAILLPGFGAGTWQLKFYTGSKFFDNNKKIKDYTEEEFNKLVFAKPEKVLIDVMDGEMNTTYEGIVERFNRLYIKNSSEKSESTPKKMSKYTKVEKCIECNGKRYNEKVLSCKINGYNIADFTSMQVDELLQKVQEINNKEINPLIISLSEKLENLINIGLDYVSLNRETSTLSGGESQRVKMVKHLTSSLSDMIYIFDEPSIGLHPRDVHRLNSLLLKLRDKGNTVIVVEHDPDVIKIADFIVDVGPKAGASGGQITFTGTYKDLLLSETLTGKFMNTPLPINDKPRSFNLEENFVTERSSLHNLKNISISIPQGIFTVITGVAGSGKSTLIHHVFANQYLNSIIIDQSAVSTNIRSNSATFTGIMDYIRQEFGAATNTNPSLFSFNSEGACEKCNGLGYIETDLSFMDSVKNICDECEDTRFKREVLELKMEGKSISNVMNMTILEADEFFQRKEIKNKLKNIIEVGLHYLTLGQPLSTLSGGECQRLKLAKELNKKGNIYIMDEPTTGLHFSDISNILEIINKLIKKGNTVKTIEHNLDIIRRADWIIDLEIDGGNRGGEIVFEGTPLELKKCKRSLTAKYI